ncbi:MAG: hypothetical protein IT210_10075 [Armatimonadetes bacterium]|nr:hypothetical protein [Armatimonadota bacterium]
MLLRLCISWLVWISILPAYSKPRINATINGYFLTPQGQLVRRAVHLSSEAKFTLASERLHLLWSNYYFEGLLESTQPVYGVRIFLGHSLIYPRLFPKPTSKVTLPDWRIPLSMNPRYGFPPVIEIEGADRKRSRVLLHAIGVEILPLLPLKIDWLTLERIHLIRQFLKKNTDRWIIKLQTSKIPFVILGEEGQIVMIDPPQRPLYMQRYTGPSPLSAQIYYGMFNPNNQSLSQNIVKLQSSAIHLISTSNWCALPELTQTHAAKLPDGVLTLEAIIHKILDFKLYTKSNFNQDLFDNSRGIVPSSFIMYKQQMAQLWSVVLSERSKVERKKIIKYVSKLRQNIKKDSPRFYRTLHSYEIIEGIIFYLEKQILREFFYSPEGIRLKNKDAMLQNRSQNIEYQDYQHYIPTSHFSIGESGLYIIRIAESLHLPWKKLLFSKRLTINQLLAMMESVGNSVNQTKSYFNGKESPLFIKDSSISQRASLLYPPLKHIYKNWKPQVSIFILNNIKNKSYKHIYLYVRGMYYDIYIGQQLFLDIPIYPQRQYKFYYTIPGETYYIYGHCYLYYSKYKKFILTINTPNFQQSFDSLLCPKLFEFSHRITAQNPFQWQTRILRAPHQARLTLQIIGRPLKIIHKVDYRVQVLDEITNKPISQAVVILKDVNKKLCAILTDSEGIATFYLESGNYIITVYDSKYTSCYLQRYRSISVVTQDRITDTYVLHHHYPIKGRIMFNGFTGDIRKVRVQAYQPGSAILSGTVNPNIDRGTYEFCILNQGEITEGEWLLSFIYKDISINIKPIYRKVIVSGDCDEVAGALKPKGHHINASDCGLFIFSSK